MDKNKEQEIKDFQNFIIAEAKSKGKDPNAYAKELGEDGMKEAYKRFQAQKQKKAQKAAHGAKLQYFRTLKNQCPEGEELYYYKKGGSVGCGCKKKEDGGEMKPKKDCGGGPVAKFKKMRQGGQPKVVNGSTKQPTIQGTAKMQEEFKRKQREKERQRKIDEQSLKDYEEGNNGNSDNPPDSKAMSKEYIKKQESKKRSSGGYHTIMADKCGSKVVKKFKKHHQGGSLNGIPFMQEGTPKAGIRYKGGKKDSFKNENHENVDVIMGQKPNFYTHAPVISRIISSDGNDTTFVEVPEHTSFTSIKPRVAKNNWIEDLNNKKIYNNSPEYYIMRRRFSEASLASPGKFKFFVSKPYTPLKYIFGN